MTVLKPGLDPIRSVPLLVKVPVPRDMLPALANWPLLANDAFPLRLNAAPAAISIVPAFAAKPVFEVKVPLCTRKVPELTKLATWNVMEPVSASVPRFTTLAALLSCRPMLPCCVSPAANCSVCPVAL